MSGDTLSDEDQEYKVSRELNLKETKLNKTIILKDLNRENDIAIENELLNKADE